MVNVFEQSAYYLVCAVGITFVLVSGANDMSVGSQVAFSSVVATLYLAAGGSIPASMGIMLGAALVIGLCNGLFVVVIGLPPFMEPLPPAMWCAEWWLIIQSRRL